MLYFVLNISIYPSIVIITFVPQWFNEEDMITVNTLYLVISYAMRVTYLVTSNTLFVPSKANSLRLSYHMLWQYHQQLLNLLSHHSPVVTFNSQRTHLVISYAPTVLSTVTKLTALPYSTVVTFNSQQTHLVISYALTVPSRDAEITNFLLWLNCTPQMLEVCSWNVTKQKPVLVFHSFTCGGRYGCFYHSTDCTQHKQSTRLTQDVIWNLLILWDRRSSQQ